MEAGDRSKRKREGEGETSGMENSGSKGKGQGTRLPPGIIAQPMRDAWKETAANVAQEVEKGETKCAPPEKETPSEPTERQKEGEEDQRQQLQEMKTLVEMALGDAERDKTVQKWQNIFHISITCDTGVLGMSRKEFVRTDEWRLLERLGKGRDHLFLHTGVRPTVVS